MRRRHGFTLIGMVAFAGFFLSVTLITLGLVDGARRRLDDDKQAQQAIVLALGGLDYAQRAVRHGEWRPPLHFRSPDLDGGAFEVVLEPDGRTRATGICGRHRRTLERRLP